MHATFPVEHIEHAIVVTIRPNRLAGIGISSADNEVTFTGMLEDVEAIIMALSNAWADAIANFDTQPGPVSETHWAIDQGLKLGAVES